MRPWITPAAIAAMLLASARADAVVVTTTADFREITSPSSTHTAWYDATSSFTTSQLAPPGEDGELASANYREIEADDTSDTDKLLSSAELRHFRFRFALTHTRASITQIQPFWVGSTQNGQLQTLYIWKFSTSTWEARGSHSASTNTQIDGGAITAITDYVDASGNVYLCVVAADPGNAAREFRTDHVRVVVTASTNPPEAPSSLGQFRSDGTTSIAIGDTIPESTVVAKGTATDPDGESVRLAVEMRPLGTAFTGVATRIGPLVAGGSTMTATNTGLSNGGYHWQAWTIDNNGAESAKVSFGGNAETAADFRVDVPPRTYYVAKTGNDTGCSAARENAPGSPFLSIQAAVNCVKTVYSNNLTGRGLVVVEIQDSGTYAEMVTVNGITTTAADRLMIRSAPGLTTHPLITGSGVRKVGLIIEGVHNTIVDGIRFTNFSGGTGTSARYYAGINVNGANDVEVRNCTIYGTGDFGITVGWNTDSASGARADRVWIHHNLIYDIRAAGTDANNRGDCIHIMAGSQSYRIENNTIHDCDQSAIHTMNDSALESGGTVRNNVFSSTTAGSKILKIGLTGGGDSGLVSDYNDLYVAAGVTGVWADTDQATLADWRAASGKDASSIAAAPLFVDVSNADPALWDLHELSNAGYRKNGDTTWYLASGSTCSPAIDAAAPSSGWPNEPAPNGYRRNMGRYGDTAEASKSCACTEPLSDGTDANDSRAASRVCPLVRGSLLSGAQSSGTDTTDWFFFNASPAAGYKFDLTITSAAKFDLFLYDATGALIAQDAPGAGGTQGPGATRSITATLASALYYVEVRYVSGTSTYDLTASFASPLSSDVHGFEVSDAGGFVRARWETGPESDALGFRLVRDGGGETTVVGPDPITPVAAFDGGYVQDDHHVVCGERYEYLLEELRPDGSSAYVGPASITPCADRAASAGCAVAPEGRSGLAAIFLLAMSFAMSLATWLGARRRT